MRDIINSERKYIMYVHISPSNKRYYGITSAGCKRRWQNGNGYKTQQYFYRAIEKYGWNNFQHIVLFNNLTENEAKLLEQCYIALYDTTNKNKGYNITDGGEGVRGYKHTEEWDAIKDVLEDYVSPRSLLYHYYSIAKGVYATHFKEDQVILKKYFYVVRPLLAGAYVLGEEDIPPMAFEELAKEYLPLNLRYDIDHLLAIKKSSGEKVIGDRIPIIDEWIESELERLYGKLNELPKLESKSDKELTELFYKLVG